jgi:hypothetical protein
MASEKQVKSNFRSSPRLHSYWGLDGGEVANPTPASQMYSQLSIEDKSSCCSCEVKVYGVR